MVRNQLLRFHNDLVIMRDSLRRRSKILKFEEADPTDSKSTNFGVHQETYDDEESDKCNSFAETLVRTPRPIYNPDGQACNPKIGSLSSVLTNALVHSQHGSSSLSPDFCSLCGTPYAMLHIKFDFCSDGVALWENRAKNKHSWPWFASLIYISPCVHRQHIKYYLPSNIAPVLFGFYYGAEKPKRIDEVFRPLLLEMILAKHLRICTLEPRFFVGDGPGRAFFRSFPAANAEKGCEG